MTSEISAVVGTVDLLGLGEPTHLEPAFAQLRNHLFESLVGEGFRSIALESDRVAALVADAYVRGEDVSLERALAEGFSHGLGAVPANRDLLVWMRERNAAGLRLSVYGFDAPIEMMSAPSPRPYLGKVLEILGEAPDEVSDDEERWSATEAVLDHTRSIGRGPEANALRVRADDLVIKLAVAAPRLGPEQTRIAEAHLSAAIGLLRYHAQAAEPLPEAERTSRMLAVRDALMARNLLEIRLAEAHRGPTLVFAHNRHLQRNASRWTLSGMDLEWPSAGAIVGSLLGDRYAVTLGSLGASPSLELGEPAAGTFEGQMPSRPYAVIPAAEVPKATGRPADPRYFPLDAESIAAADAILHVPTGLSPAVLADRILKLPGVDHIMGESDDWFFYVGPDRRQPFATIVEHDVPGWDESSQLERPGVFRFNVELGRAEFERAFGFPPKEFDDHAGEFDFARLDLLFPHPGYALYGWASIVQPGPSSLDNIDRLLAHAHERATDRHERALRRAAVTEAE